MRNDLTKTTPIYPETEWEIVENEFKPEHNFRNETVFSLGNGFLGLRGNFEEGYQGSSELGLEGTYLNGFYESEPIQYGEIAYGYAKRSQTMLNVTNGKVIRLFVAGEEFQLQSGTVSEYRRALNLKDGILTRRLVWQTPSGKTIRLYIERLVSFERKCLAAIRYEVTPLNFSEPIRLVSLIDGNVGNLTVANDPRVGANLSGQALQIKSKRIDQRYLEMIQLTKNSGLTMICAADHWLDTENPYSILEQNHEFSVGLEFEIKAKQGIPIRLEKYLAYATTRDFPEAELSATAQKILAQAKQEKFVALYRKQQEYLDAFWRKADVDIQGAPSVLQGIRFNIFHLLQSTGKDGKTNIGAKGLTGESYEGHYFWDSEMYIVPFFLYHHPEISRKLLEYRFHILDKARERAREMSHPKGALFPWRTIDGEECSAYFPAGTAQYHINADIAYAIKKYLEATEDWDFLVNYGAEILFETARLWADLGDYIESKDNKFCINCVTGPDEYSALVNNNCYTNLMARENLKFAWETAGWLKQNVPEKFREISRKIGLDPAEITGWQKAAAQMYLPFDEKNQLYLQDDSFLSRARWDFENTPLENYPLLVNYHPLVIYRYQVCKQADLIMALFLLGEHFTLAEKRRNFEYYEQITTHDSSLSPCIFSIVASEIGDFDKAYRYFMKTVRMDLDDLQGNTKYGVHVANMAGTWMCLVNGFAGMRVENGILSFTPYLPEHWKGYSCKIAFQGRLIQVRVNGSGADFRLLKGAEISIQCKGKPLILQRKVKGFIFDLDGVLTDTSEYHYQAWQRLADEAKLPFSRKDNEALRGISRKESLLLILKGRSVTEAEMNEMMDRKNSYYLKMIQRITPQDLLPGVKELLTEIRAAGFKVALGSSSKNAAEVVSRLGIESLLDAVSDGFSVEKHKPAPDLFLNAAGKLGLSPEECVVVEDAAAGIAAAQAGCFISVGLGTPEQIGAADAIFPNLSGVQLQDLLNALQVTEALNA